MADCRASKLDPLETTGDLERAAGEAVASLKACNEDLARARDWNEAE